MLFSFSRTFSLARRMARRMRASAGDAPSNISSSFIMQRFISSSALLWVMSRPARL